MSILTRRRNFSSPLGNALNWSYPTSKECTRSDNGPKEERIFDSDHVRLKNIGKGIT